MIIVESKRKRPATMLKKIPDARFADVIINTNWDGEKFQNFRERRKTVNQNQEKTKLIIT